MAPAVLVSLMGLLTIVAIYFWWGRKVASPPTEQKFPIGSHEGHP
jgi:hypothetical protein